MGRKRDLLSLPCLQAWTRSLKNPAKEPPQLVSQRASSYTDDIDLPPSDDEDEEYASREEQQQNAVCKGSTQQQRFELKPFDVSLIEKELKKRERKDILAAHATEQAKQEALKDDRDAFSVVIGSRASILDSEADADANVKGVTIENFSVSACGKENNSYSSHNDSSNATHAYLVKSYVGDGITEPALGFTNQSQHLCNLAVTFITSDRDTISCYL